MLNHQTDILDEEVNASDRPLADAELVGVQNVLSNSAASQERCVLDTHLSTTLFLTSYF